MNTVPHYASNGNVPHFVYELVDPRLDFNDNSSVFYIGITIDLYARYRQHMRFDGINVQKDARIQEILASGHLPIMRTLEQVPNFAKALEQEQYWIHHSQRLGSRLTNAQVQEHKLPKLVSSIPHDTWTKKRCGRRNTNGGTRQLFELYWDERKQGQSFGAFFKDDLSDDMCADGWGYYPKHYISKKGRSHAEYKHWQRRWIERKQHFVD